MGDKSGDRGKERYSFSAWNKPSAQTRYGCENCGHIEMNYAINIDGCSIQNIFDTFCPICGKNKWKIISAIAAYKKVAIEIYRCSFCLNQLSDGTTYFNAEIDKFCRRCGGNIEKVKKIIKVREKS